MIKTRRGVGEGMKESGRDPIKTGQRSCGKGGAGANAVDQTHTHTRAPTHWVCLRIYPMIHVACQGLCNYSWDEGSSGGGLVREKSFAPRINTRRRRSGRTDPGSARLFDRHAGL